MLLQELQTRIAATPGQGLGVETSVFRGIMPTAPDVCVSVVQYGGEAPTRSFGSTALQYHNPSVQVTVRGVKYDHDGPLAMAQAIMDYLAAVQDVTLSGTRYYLVTPKQAPMLFKRDESNRVYFVFNCDVFKDPS